MSSEKVYNSSEYSLHTPPQPASPAKSNRSGKPPVAPKPIHLSTGRSCCSEIQPTVPGHQEIPLPASQQVTCSELRCGPQRQVQTSKLAIHSTRVRVLPFPHPYIRTSPPPPPELPPRPRSTSSPGPHHKTHTVTENEKQPPIPPKPKNVPHDSHSEDLKILPAESECSLTLTQLANNHSNCFPIQVRVQQGFYGQTSSQTVNSNDTYNIVCPKHEEVLIIRDENQHYYSVPLSSAIQFSLLYTPDGMTHEEAMRGQNFKAAANIVEIRTPPKVICARKSCSGVARNEVFVILGVQKPRMNGKKGLKVFSLLTQSLKTLPHDCAGDFSTDPSLIRMYPADIHASLHYLKCSLFPCDAKLYFNSEVADQLQGLPMAGHLTGVITICELNTRRSLVAYQVFSENHNGEDLPIFDIPLDENLSDVEVFVAEHDLKNESGEKQLTSSTVSVLKSVSSNPSKLQPWKPEQSDATKTLLHKTARSGYENVGIRLEVNPQWAHSANMHELMEADAVADKKYGYDTITFDNVPSGIQMSDESETDTDSPSHESNGYDSDRPQCPPRSLSLSRPRSLIQKATPRHPQSEECLLPVRSKSPTDNVFAPLRPPKKKQRPVPLQAPSQGGYTTPLSNASRVEDEYTTCTTNETENDCKPPGPFQGRHEAIKCRSHPPKQELSMDPSLQQMQEQIQSLQKQVFSLMERKEDDLSSTATEKVTQPTDHIPGDSKLQNNDLKYIMQTLCDLSTWYLLGVYLDVPKGKLDQFHATYSGGPDAVERCKIETISYWLENARKPTWAKLAAAVLIMGRKGIAEKISKRCGVRLPLPDEEEHYEAVLEVSPNQVSKLKKEMELKDQEFRLVEEKQGQLEEQLRNLQSELINVRDLLQFNERLTRKLITDGQRIKSDLSRTKMSHDRNHVSNHSLAVHRMRDRILSLRKEQKQSSSKLEEAQKEQRELWKMLHNLESKIVTTSQELHQLQTRRQSARAALQQQELAINESLVSTTEHQYYNIVIQDGKVEMRLTQQQVETLHRKVSDENLKVKQLHQQLQLHQRKLREVTRQNEQLDRKSQAAAELEEHQRAYLESTLEADVMQCQIEISTTEFHKQQMESRIHFLRSHVTNLKRRQRQYEKIELQKKSSSQRGKHTDLSRRPRFQSLSESLPSYRKPHCYYEEVDSPSSTRSQVHHFHGEQRRPFNPTSTPFIPAPHAPLFQKRSLRERHHKPHPPLQRFNSAFPYFSNPPYKARHRSAEEEYAGQLDEGYVIENFGEIEAVENGSNNVSMLNGATYEPVNSFSSDEYDDFTQEAEYLPSNTFDSDYEDIEECYSETEFT